MTTETKQRTSPKASEDHQELIAYANKEGFNTLLIRKLLWGLNAPSRLDLLIPISQKLSTSLIYAASESPNVLQNTMHKEWLLALNFISEHSGELVLRIGDHLVNFQEKKRHPLHGKTLSRNPLYSILINEHESQEFSKLYQHLQIHIFIAHLKLMYDHTTLTGYEYHIAEKPILGGLDSSANDVCRYIRDLSLFDNRTELVNLEKRRCQRTNMQIHTCSNRIFGTYFAELHHELPSEQQSVMVTKFGVFFNHTFVNPTTRNSQGGGSRFGSKTYLTHDGFTRLSGTLSKLSTYVSDDEKVTVQQIVEHINLDDLASLDLLDDEFSTGSSTYLVSMGKVYTTSFLARHLSAKGVVRKITMENQLLKGRWSTMTMWEALYLIQFCESEFNLILKQENQAGKELALESITLIVIMLWTGSSLERAVRTSIRAKSEIERSEITYITDTQEWHIENNLVTRTKTPTKKEIDCSRPREKSSLLPDITGIGDYLNSLNSYKNKNHQLFKPKSLQKYRKSIQKILSKLPAGHRATESKISNFLFNMIVNKYNHNIAAACLITASEHRLGKSILHYSTPSQADLRRIYIDTTQPIQKFLAKDTSQQEQPKSHMSANYIGSDYCPKTSSIQNLVKKLAKQVRHTLKDRKQSTIIAYHNDYTIYTQQLLSYGLGFRSVNDAFIQETNIHPNSRLAVISDKDNEKHYHSRVVWVPDVVQRQLKNYAQHREHIISLLKQTNVDKEPNSEIPSIFLLDDKFSIMPLKPKYIKQYVDPILPLPLNVNRRYLRTKLEERGCPSETINYFMGHWSRGEEPWSKHSSFSFADYAHELKQYLPEILSRVGWKAVKSRVSI